MQIGAPPAPVSAVQVHTPLPHWQAVALSLLEGAMKGPP